MPELKTIQVLNLWLSLQMGFFFVIIPAVYDAHLRYVAMVNWSQHPDGGHLGPLKGTCLSFPPEDITLSAQISDCLADISTWMKNLHLQLNLAKTELMVFPAKQAIHHNISINIDSLSLVPSKTARNLGVIIDDQLTFTAHIASVSRSCRFVLYNIRKIRPYLTQYAT